MTGSAAPSALTSAVRLTEFARCAGCASKMGPADLRAALATLPAGNHDPRLLVGRELFDDAAVFRVSDAIALIQTVDFFAPIVDDPYTFGQVAAANALSDVYAMGGVPLTALNITAFPVDTFPLEILTEILAGGQDKVAEAGAVVVGGHTVTDPELKYGLAVTGQGDPRRLLLNTAARVGDQIVLTKAIGTGVLATAAKKGMASGLQVDALQQSMCALNAQASRVALQLEVRCGTDVTGFGLLGHALNVARGSGARIRVAFDRLPLLPGAAELWLAGARTGGADRNMDYVNAVTSWGNTNDVQRGLLVDPQTSGGLLLFMQAKSLPRFLSLVPGAVHIGEVVEVAATPKIEIV